MSEGQVPPTAPAAPAAHAAPMSAVPAGLRGWMLFVGIMTLLAGVLNVLSCFGLINGILMIVGAIALFGCASALDAIRTVDAHTLVFMRKIKTFFVMLGWTYIIGIVLAIVLLAFYGAAIFALVMSEASRG